MRRKKKKPEENKNGKEIAINIGPIEKRGAILENGRHVDFIMERKGLEHYAGSIYKGRVNSIVRGIEAAFVDIGMEKNGFLHVSDVVDKNAVLKDILPDEYDLKPKVSRGKKSHQIDNVLKKGQEFLVQVVKEALGTKGPRITTFISIPGRYLVLTPYDSHIGISRRIKDRETRRKIKDILNRVRPNDRVGCIVRTMSEDCTEQELREEMNYLINLWKKIKERETSRPAPLVVYEEYGAVLRMVRDKFTEDVERLVVDSKDEYSRIMKFLKAFRPALRKKVKLYKGQMPLFQKVDLEKQIDEIFERKVFLKSGGYLVIEQTEGLVAIDVNTGSFTGKNNLEETAFKTNMEAAKEIPRQLMLRDIGGIIIIDFIDMDVKAHRDKVFNMIQEELKKDKARINLRAISQFGVVEMTRQRMRKSLESTSHTECPYCNGKGVIKNSETIAIETVRKIDKILSSMSGRKKHLVVMTHPDINLALFSDQAKLLSDIQRKYRCKIDLKENVTFHREEVIINRVN